MSRPTNWVNCCSRCRVSEFSWVELCRYKRAFRDSFLDSLDIYLEGSSSQSLGCDTDKQCKTRHPRPGSCKIWVHCRVMSPRRICSPGRPIFIRFFYTEISTMAHSDALAVIYELLSIYFISVMTIAVSVILQTNKQKNSHWGSKTKHHRLSPYINYTCACSVYFNGVVHGSVVNRRALSEHDPLMHSNVAQTRQVVWAIWFGASLPVSRSSTTSNPVSSISTLFV